MEPADVIEPKFEKSFDMNEFTIISAPVKARKSLQYLAGFSASLAAFSFGTTLGWTGQLSERLLNGTEYGFPLTEDELGWVGSLVSLGGAFLSLFAGSLCSFFGRKRAMLVLILVSSAGWANLIWAQNVLMLYLGRFLTGMAGGAYCVAVPMYTSEIAQKEIRGRLGCFLQLQISFGIFVAMLIGKFASIKVFTGLCGVVPIIFGMIFVFMPESPTHYLIKGKEDKAIKAMRRLRGVNYDCDLELKEVKISLDDQIEGNMFSVLFESLKQTGPRKACIIGVGLMFFKVLCAVDAITVYMSHLLELTDMDFSETTGGIIFAGIQTVAAVAQSYVVEKLGRKMLLLFSEAVMTLCLFIVAFSLFIRQREIIPQGEYLFINYLPLIALCLFAVAFSLGLGPIPFMYISEIFSQDIKNLMSSFCSFLCWILAFAVVKVFLVIKSDWGADVAFFIFGLISVTGIGFIAFLVIETKGKSFLEIQKELSER